MQKYLEIKTFLTELKLNYVLTEDSSLLNQIEIEKINLRDADPEVGEAMTTDAMLVHLRKWMGIWLDKKKITVVEFRDLVNEYVRSNKKE